MTRPRRGSLAALLAAAALLGAACGASSSPAPATPAGPPGSPAGATPTPAGTSGVSAAPGSSSAPASAAALPPGAFTFSLPTGWRAVPMGGNHDALVAGLRSTNAAFADSLASRLANLAATATYVAFDASPEAVRAGNLTTLVVTEVQLPLAVTLATFTTTVQGQVQQLVEQPVEAKKILITSGEAYDIEFIAPVQRPDGSQGSAAITQILYVLPGRGYVMTFTAPPAVAPSYGKAFADIATSFTIKL